MTQTSHADRQRHRDQLTADILQQVRNAVQDELAGAPESITLDELGQIEQTVMAHTQHVVDALSIDEMQSEGALLSHIASARTDTNRLIGGRRRLPGPRSPCWTGTARRRRPTRRSAEARCSARRRPP